MSLLQEAVEMLAINEERVVSGEVIQPTRHKTAAGLATQFIALAEKRAGGGVDKGAEVIAKEYAAKFHKALIAEIEDQIKMKNMRRYSEYGEAGSFRRTA